jgi:nicotinate-nucleotide pyrophosphorylase (carboxylating)
VSNELPDLLINTDVLHLVKAALKEDLGPSACDATTTAVVASDARACAHIVAREDCVVAGTGVGALVFNSTDKSIECETLIADGMPVNTGQRIMAISGPARGILTGERVALNFMQRMSGIATMTQKFMDAVAGSDVKILDTRKTGPCMRILEKYAVLCGGGTNHRMDLGEMMMIKDNHRAFWGGSGELKLDDAVRQAREAYPNIPVEIEVDTFEELKIALAGEPDWVLLDNMSPEQMRECVEYCAGRAKLEASGGITLETVAAAAATGVDAVSVGGLTHSARAVDLSMELEPLV